MTTLQWFNTTEPSSYDKRAASCLLRVFFTRQQKLTILLLIKCSKYDKFTIIHDTVTITWNWAKRTHKFDRKMNFCMAFQQTLACKRCSSTLSFCRFYFQKQKLSPIGPTPFSIIILIQLESGQKKEERKTLTRWTDRFPGCKRIHCNNPRIHDDDHKTSVVITSILLQHNPVPEAWL